MWMINEKLIIDPTFIISLDVELLCGIINDPESRSKKKHINLLNNDDTKGRGCIDVLLNILERHNIPATWAIVGHLFLDHCKKEDGIPHKDMPRFKPDWYSADPCTDLQKDPLYYGRDIVEKILSNRIEHEIGYHSFSHVDFSECSREVAEAEIKISNKLAKEFGITFESFVFPGNKIGRVDILKEYNFKIYRGKNLGRYDISQSFLIRKFNGGIDKVIATPTEPEWVDGIWMIPSSMFFCDSQIKFSVLWRAKLGLYWAIRTKKVFHVFLHPHNLLLYPSLKNDLDRFLEIVAKKRDEGKIEIMSMEKFVGTLDEKMRNGLKVV
ncbi:MAG: Peptidoglycan/xylan/chitin deacetylase, PgdA/CDA1 family [Candidatus Methanomarinus sp.]|nr:MAG: Peptidoglycan/xylan/chitin deacetylase, PgdA/CDA1 family [ANME-2 cluster archaeon]KAF5426130.1 Peptidoglycan/xylan/chitin deacetylase [ANME-2 cluster archaeon]